MVCVSLYARVSKQLDKPTDTDMQTRMKERNKNPGERTSIIDTETEAFEPRSDKRDPLAIKVKSEILIEKERPSCC